MQKELLEKIGSPQFSVFVVWLPVLGADSYPRAQQAQNIFLDARAKPWWDSTRALGQSYQKILPLASNCQLAWDVYLLYGSGVKRFRYALAREGNKGWTPPAPDFWMHQLSCMSRELYLNINVFRGEVERMLAESQAAQKR